MLFRSPIEVSASVEIKRLLEKIMNADENKKLSTYRRTVVNNVLIHNNRIDMIKSLLFKRQQLGFESSRVSIGETVFKQKKNRVKPRRIRILEALRELSSLNLQDFKRRESTSTYNSSISSDRDFDERIGLDQFDIISQLGGGSFGEVYLVRYKPLSKLYAMKVLCKSRFSAQNLVKYAKTERDVLCYTKSPFIVGLDFAFQTNTKLFLILEYCPGYDLNEP